MNYRVVDFRDLATLWFNEFLPQMENKAAFVESAGIIYINNVNLESTRKKTLKFMKGKISEMLALDASTHIFVQEPKPVNNIRLRPALKLVESIESIGEANRDRILHLANRRYVFESDTVFVSQNKEMDELLHTIFFDLAKNPMLRTKFYSIQSLEISDFVEVAQGFFPKNQLKIQANLEGNHIKVRSSNEVLSILSDRIMKGKPVDSAIQDYVEKCKTGLLEDICQML